MKMRLTSLGLAIAFSVLACSSDDDNNGSQQQPVVVTRQDVVKNYATIVHENYEDSLAKAKTMQAAIHTFVAAPSAATLDAAKKAWVEARPSYGESEAFRFYGGPIDADDTGPEGRINSWPIDENFIDYVQGKDSVEQTGIINETTQFPQITIDVIKENNQQGGEAGEKNVSSGWHAIEFLLWGQDFSEDDAGKRPYTDYVTTGGTAQNQARRGAYLNAATDLLIEDLESVAAQWRTGDANLFASKLTAGSADEGLTKMLNGIGKMSGGELQTERMFNSWQTGEQEEEHSCFSDTTLQDLAANAKGIENVYLGRYGSKDGPGIDDLVKAKNATLDTKVREKLTAARNAIAAIDARYDQAIQPNNPAHAKVKTAMDALKEVTASLADVANELGLTINLE